MTPCPVRLLSQAGQMTQIGVVEHLKLENVTLSHQLSETQHRSIKDKERIAVQLQSIEVLFLMSLKATFLNCCSSFYQRVFSVV